MNCSTGKIEYLSPGSADKALRKIRKRARRSRGTRYGRTPIRFYRCPECGHWHLTSEPRRDTRKAA